MSSSSTVEVYDLLILVDATYSMSSYLNSLQISLPQIIQISNLTDCFSRIGLLAYRDYCDKELLEWSGWMSTSVSSSEKVDLVAKARELRPLGGGDGPEATKTGLARAYELMRKDATTIILLYTDAPPHTSCNGVIGDRSSNLGPEKTALSDKNSYGGYGPHFADLVSGSRWLSGRCGDKKAQVFCILDSCMYADSANYYNYLSTMTNGSCFFLSDSHPLSISKVSIEILLSWMGAEKAGNAMDTKIPAHMIKYKSLDGIELLENENDPAADKFFLATNAGKTRHNGDGENVSEVKVSVEVLKEFLPKKTTPVQDFAKRYNIDPRYKKLAVDHVKNIIEEDVLAISINPVFGSLWRAVCNDRDNEERDAIIAAFGLKVERINNADEKANMKLWLEESYDYTAEVMEAIESVPESERFPCVCLDPTQVFTLDGSTEDDNDEVNKPITEFQREELLEIGRSCDYKILRRLGRVLTRLTYIKSAADMPAHIAAAPETEIPRIPMSLASQKYKRKFWRILLHIVVPGTMLSARPAALLAALSIRLGVEPLLHAANQEMLLWRDRWNNLEIPETWNLNCLGLLMDADKAYRVRLSEKDAEVSYYLGPLDNNERPKKRVRLTEDLLTSDKEKTLLRAEDLALFQSLVSYKMLELNLDTSLTAQVGWTPTKSKAPMGPTVICASCEYPRSVTVMGAQGKCGLCLWNEMSTLEMAREVADVTVNASKDDNEETLATWVECNRRACRAHYIVYLTESLNVKPKCHYCRTGTEAPVLECSKCFNRVIWPEAYRTSEIEDFECYACRSGRKTIVDMETTAKALSLENSTEWLLRNEQKIAEPLNKRSLFHTISTAGTEKFCEKVQVFPDCQDTKLVLNGKPLHNAPSLIKELESWVLRRRTELGTCSLCFSSRRKVDLHLACGRSGCPQRVCDTCLRGWYGLNAAGRIINTAALSCPFCRRSPTTKTLVKYGAGIHAVADLQNAVTDAGKWIHAWCVDCGYTKRYIERVCAAGAPAELSRWSCEDCVEGATKKLHNSLKDCPECGVVTQKSGGCNHITCNCGTHWCWHCGKKCSVENIYHHMNTEHGGIYGGPGAEDADTDGEEDVGDW